MLRRWKHVLLHSLLPGLRFFGKNLCLVPGSPLLDQPLQEDSKVQTEGPGYFPFYHPPLNSTEVEHPPSSRKYKPLPPTRDFCSVSFSKCLARGPAARSQEPLIGGSPVALSPGSCADSGQCIWPEDPSLHPRAPPHPLPATFFLLASSSHQAACAKAQATLR